MKDRWEDRDKLRDADVIWQAEYKVEDIQMAGRWKGQSSLMRDNHMVLRVSSKSLFSSETYLVTCLEGDKT